VITADLFYDRGAHHADWRAAGAVAIEMEAAAVLTVAALHGAQAGCALLVTDTFTGEQGVGAEQRRRRIGERELHDRELALGGLALSALTR
ncbi:MAG: purine-nucleoside phosphorylase, partial [Solirubrobacteraceae bacterium]